MGKKNNLFRNDPGAIGHPYTKEKKKKTHTSNFTSDHTE